MKGNKKRHGKKSYSFRRRKARTRTSSSVSSEATCYMVPSSNKQHSRRSSTISSLSTPSFSRSSSIRKKGTRNDFLPALELRSEGKLKSIAFYIDSREEMVRHMFASLRRGELNELLSENLKKLEESELRYLCVNELNGMSKKNICAILKGKDFAESSESEEEKSETVVVNANMKTSKAEIAIADSTTEMIAPNLSCVFHSVDTSSTAASSSTTNASEVHFAAVENISSTKIHQENETVVHSDFPVAHRTSFLSKQRSEDSFSASDQIAVITTTENDDELEDGEVVSDEERSSNLHMDAILIKDQNCSQHLTTNRDPFVVSPHNSSSASILKNSGHSGSSTNKVREERRLRMLELELRARAIEALIKRSDNNS
ncbi:unnamed protein product [Litomosoides sigmodontis]|uniref:Uncharacterized protein n=1 Tax=Litomosoides sigmodontis TaxID=42156 RepID=A0A3P6TQ03_LITSI|nr:unnamed protein product [Litomosoides sigmodontis]